MIGFVEEGAPFPIREALRPVVTEAADRLALVREAYERGDVAEKDRASWRKAEILAAIEDGWSYRKIAEHLGITYGRVGQIATEES